MKWLLLFLLAGCAMPSKTESWCLPKRVTRTIAMLITLAFGATSSYANDSSWALGEDLNHNISVCLTKEDAIAIADVDAKDGVEAAGEAYSESPRCATIPVTNAKVGKVVYTAKVKRDGAAKTLSVVEILRGGKLLGYMLTSMPVVAVLVPDKPHIKPERNT